MAREAAEARASTKWSLFSDRTVKGLKGSLGRFAHGLGPGREGPERPVPLFFQLLDPETYYLSYRPGDERYQVLTNDQNRFSLPRSLAPVVAVLLPGDEDNPTDSTVVVRHAYSEGAFLLLADLLDDNYCFSLKEFLRLAKTLATSLAFLHEHGIAHGQWNSRSVICVPVEADGTAFDSASSHRFDLINTGVSYRDAGKIPSDLLERGYFPEEIVPPSTKLPDYEALDLQADVYCFAAFLKDLLQHASRFEELTKQAGAIQDHLRREAHRAGQKPSAEQLRSKEQEILDHLYTIKLKTEEMIRDGLRARGLRSHSGELRDRSADLYRRTTEYADRLFDIGFERVNVFGDDLQHYVPYQVTLTPTSVNNFEDTAVDLAGDGLPYELVRVSLGDWDRPVEVVESTPTSLRFRVPRGFSVGSHRVFINNRRTDGCLEVVTPWWIRVEPASLPKPWPGFGNIRVRILGEDLPRDARYSLVPERTGSPEGEGEAAASSAAPGEETDAPLAEPIDAVSVSVEDPENGIEDEPGATIEVAPRPTADASGDTAGRGSGSRPAPGASESVGRAADAEAEPLRRGSIRVEFPPDTPPGAYTIVVNGLDSGLGLHIDEALPDPVIDLVEPLEVFNHRDQELTLFGSDLHASMVVDLGEDSPAGCALRIKSDRSAALVLPGGYPAGEYTVRTNRADTELRLVVREPVWTACEPQAVKFRRNDGAAALRIEGEALPAINEDSSDVYHLSARKKGAPVRATVLEEERVHELELPPNVRTGRHAIHFANEPTGLSVRIRRQLPAAVRAGAIMGIVLILAAAGILFGPALASRLRPEITGLETPVIYSFGQPEARVTGARLTRIALHDASGAVVGEFPLEPAGTVPDVRDDASETIDSDIPEDDIPEGTAPVDDAEDEADPAGDSCWLVYSFEAIGIGPGTYGLSARGSFLEGKPCDLELRVRSPEFYVEPQVIDRLLGASLQLMSASGFPFAEGNPGVLHLSRSSAEERAAPSREFALQAGVGVPILPGRFRAGEEGEYRVSVDGQSLDGDLAAALPPGGDVVTVDVVGPVVSAIEPARVTLGTDRRIRVELRGSRFPDGAPLGLIPLALPEAGTEAAETETEADAIAFRLEPRAGGAYEGTARPGNYALAWDLEDRDLEDTVEEISGISLAVLPHPEVTEVSPTRVPPNQPVDVEFMGVNLQSAEGITLLSLAGGDSVRIDLEPAGFRSGEGASVTYAAEALVLPAGRFRVAPGGAAIIEVAEDCKEQLEAYLRDLTGKEELLSCLAGETVTDEVRRKAAGIFFDQGLFDEAHDLYASLDDLRSRFRATFIRAFVRGQDAVSFSAGGNDAPEDPYLQAAAALRWHPGAIDGTFAVAGGPWELDYVSGHLARDPRAAVERLTLALERKQSAAAVREINRFEPALDELARARLDLGVTLLGEGAPIQAYEHFQSTVTTDASLERLGEADKARAHFYAGHATLWYGGNKVSAKEMFEKGMLPGGLAFSSLCRLYLEALGRSVSRPPPVMQFPPLPVWERAFVDGVRSYLLVLDGPNYNILAEEPDFVFQNEEERQANRDLFSSLKVLEASENPTDPFAHYGVLYFLRSAQRLAWPASIGRERWRQHRDAFLALELDDRASRVRSVFLIMGEAAPLAPSQVAVMPQQDVVSLLERIDRIDQTRLEAGFQDLLRRFKENLTLTANAARSSP